MKYHFKTQSGIENWTHEEAIAMAGPDTHRHRLISNYELLPVNRPHATVARNYARDGFMRLDGNGGDGPNYEPNSFNGPKAAPQHREPGNLAEVISGHYKTVQHAEGNDFVQAGNL